VKITAREKRFIIAGSIVVAAVLLLYAASSVLGNRETLQQEVEQKKQLLIKKMEFIAGEEDHRKRVEQYTRQLEKDFTRLLPGDNASVASAELQKILKEFADQSGVEISSKNLPAEKKVENNEMLTKISVRIDTKCNLQQLVDFLVAIENYEKFLKVEELIINSFKVQRRYDTRPSLTVVGYIRSPNTEPVAGATTIPGANSQSSSIAQKEPGR
jgi:hypothetical protein